MKFLRVMLMLQSCLVANVVLAEPTTKASATERAGEGCYWHLQDEAFQPSTIPEWVYQSPIQAFDTKEDLSDIERFAKLGVHVVHNHGIKPYWPLKRDDPASGVEKTKAAEVKAKVDKAHALGMRFCYGVYPWAPIPLLKQHPEWVVHLEDNDKIEQRVKTELGDAIKMDEYEKLGQLCVMCFNTPYADYYIDCLAEILRDYQIDGVSFDGNYHPHVCYCKSCKEKYRKDTGCEIPTNFDMNDLAYRKYLSWAGDQHEAFFVRMRKRLQEVNPEFAIMSWTINAGRWGQMVSQPNMSRRLNLVLDCPMQEWWLDEYHHGSTIAPAFGASYGWAVTNHRCVGTEAYAMSHWDPYGRDSYPSHEALRRSLLVISNGSFLPIACCVPSDDTILQEVAKRSKWQVHAEPYRWAAVLMSEQTRINYGQNKIEERYLPFPLGVFRAAYEEHLPLTIITEWNLQPEDLARYAVLILPNAACLSDQQIEAIRQYVANGGGLVASCDTSLFDEIGRPRPNFGLADVFGVNYLGRPGEPAVQGDYDFTKTFDPKTFWNDPVAVAVVSWENSPFGKDPALQNLQPNAQVSFKGRVAHVSEPTDPATKGLLVRQHSWPGKTYKIGDQPIPGAIVRQFGKGHVIYLAAGIDGAYYSYSYPYERNLLKQAIQMTASREPVVKVDAPMCVQATYFEQSDKKGRRMLVHLFNDVNTTSNHGDPIAETPLREETIPIAGIKVHFNGCKVKRFHLEPEGKTLEPVTSENMQSVEIPKLEMHSIVVAELE